MSSNISLMNLQNSDHIQNLPLLKQQKLNDL